MFAPIYALSSLHICAYLCPTTSARLRLSIPRQQCPFMPISSPPTISVYHFSSISDPSTQCRLCQIYIFLTLHFLVYIYINNCGHVYPITSISPRQQYLFRLSLPKALHFYGLSLPTSCAHFCQSHLIHTTLCVYMPRYLCQFASISAPTPLHIWPDNTANKRLSLPRQFFALAFIYAPPTIQVCMPSHLCLFPPISSSPPLPVSAYLYPTNSARLHLSLTGHFCSFISRHHFPFASISVYTPPSVRLHLSLPGQFCSFASVSTPPPLSVYVYLCPVNNVSMSLSANSGCWLLLLVCQQCPFTSISTPHTYTTDRLRLSLSGHFCSFASICSAKSTRLPQCLSASISAPPSVYICVYLCSPTLIVCVYLCLDISNRLCLPLPRKLHPFAPLPFCVCICPVTTVRLFLSTPCQQCLFSFISHPTTMLICAYLCPSTSAPVCLSLETTSARSRLSLLRQQCTFISIFETPTLTAITAQLTLSVCVSVPSYPPVCVYRYPANTVRCFL
ncbi:unnamed protein product [Acanthosepion pharaonis]|uniref:Uncharacterized protein n=1 Tax=Acanthosepion pharaonis TaxID=158019 RepID=A0A812DBQ8_ACAPH|nr:unnamed protein product [Sepia pharaonis]